MAAEATIERNLWATVQPSRFPLQDRGSVHQCQQNPRGTHVPAPDRRLIFAMAPPGMDHASKVFAPAEGGAAVARARNLPQGFPGWCSPWRPRRAAAVTPGGTSRQGLFLRCPVLTSPGKRRHRAAHMAISANARTSDTPTDCHSGAVPGSRSVYPRPQTVAMTSAAPAELSFLRSLQMKTSIILSSG